jgi:hypothetical protein
MARIGHWAMEISSPRKIVEVQSWTIRKTEDHDAGVCITFDEETKKGNLDCVEIVIPMSSLTAMVDEIVRERLYEEGAII